MKDFLELRCRAEYIHALIMRAERITCEGRDVAYAMLAGGVRVNLSTAWCASEGETFRVSLWVQEPNLQLVFESMGELPEADWQDLMTAMHVRNGQLLGQEVA